MHPVIHSRVLLGLTAHPVTIECQVGSGLPSTTIVGLPESAVREARDRIRAALINSGFSYPDGHVVINLAPGNVAKNDSFLDLPMALAVLVATEQVPTTHLSKYELLGELSLFGSLRASRGALLAARAAAASGRRLLVPAANARECALAPADTVGWASTLHQITEILQGQREPLHQPPPPSQGGLPTEGGDFAQVVGQEAAKRALALAAAGGHHLLLVGPPGTGKTMLARAFHELLPDLPQRDALEVAAIYAAAGLERSQHLRAPFRDPHHSASSAALVGGGRPLGPGELSLAHRGVLFLDELPHFKPATLNLLREPIETGEAVLARASYHVRMPCRFQLIAAMNPCPAGRVCHQDACRCSPGEVRRYQSRVSGPLLDRIDLQIEVQPVPAHLLSRLQQHTGAELSQLREQINQARATQRERQGRLNANIGNAELNRHIRQATQAARDITEALDERQLSARGLHKIWRVARTISDMRGAAQIDTADVAEALGYRALDWENLLR